MHLRNLGGTPQFIIKDAADLARIADLDPARWAATSAPVADLHADAAFLKYLDPDGVGRVRVAQVIAARDWLFARISRRSVIDDAGDALPLDALDGASDDGKALRLTAERVNREQSAADPKSVRLDDVRAFKVASAKLPFNGDKVFPPAALEDAALRAFAADAVAVLGGAADRGGDPGVDAAHVERFFTQGAAWIAWREAGPAAWCWGDDTAAAAALVRELDAKIEAYFLRCSWESQTGAPKPDAAAQPTADELEEALRKAPLAAPRDDGALSFDGPVNELYRERWEALRDTVLRRALGADATSMHRRDWLRVRATFDGFTAWERSRPAEPFETLGEEKVRAHLASGVRDRFAELFARDEVVAAEIARVDDLEKLVLFTHGLVPLANNLVSLAGVYLPSSPALMNCGSLVIDGRRLGFCLSVQDRAAHKEVAALSNIFLVYVEVFQSEGGAAVRKLVSPVTGGEQGRLRVGKRGLFVDLDGAQFDAVVTEIVDNPISVRQAAFAPFRRAAAMASTKFKEWISTAESSQESALQASTTSAVDQVQGAATVGASDVAAATDVARGAPVPPPAQPPTTSTPTAAAPAREGLKVNSIVLGGGLALAGLGAVLAGVLGVLTSLRGWLAIGSVALVVMILAGLVGWLKLRRRDLALLLEANGWAMNIEMKITPRVARLFAFVPDLPKDAHVDPIELAGERDPSDRGLVMTVLLILLCAALVLLWKFRVHAGLHG